MPYAYITKETYSDYYLYDSMTDINDVLLTAHTPEEGGPWAKIGSYDSEINGNRAVGIGASAGNNSVHVVDVGNSVVIEADLSVVNAVGSFAGIVGRVVDSSNYYAMALLDGGGTWKVATYVSGTQTDRDSKSLTVTPYKSYRVRVHIQGPIITAFINGIKRVQYKSVANTSATKHGLILDDASTGPGRVRNVTIQPHAFGLVARTALWLTSGDDDWLGRVYFLDRGDGVWLAFYRAATTHANTGVGKIHVRFSDDEGRTWTAENTTLAGAAVTGMPMTVVDGDDMGEPVAVKCANGDLLLQSMEFDSDGTRRGTFQKRSTDDGATWTNEGQQYGGDDTIDHGGQMILVGSTLYSVPWEDESGTGPGPYGVPLYVSTNHGVTWTFRAYMAPTSTGGNEAAIVHVGGNSLLGFSREHAETKTWKHVSSDLGMTWVTTDATDIFGVLQRPKLRKFGDRIYLFGRDRENENASRTVLWYSDDDGDNWIGPYYWNTGAFDDSGYCDVLQRANGQLYGATYEGSDATAGIYEYVLNVLR